MTQIHQLLFLRALYNEARWGEAERSRATDRIDRSAGSDHASPPSRHDN